MRPRLTIERAAPWVVSGMSSVYVLARTRRLSRARASRDPLLRFLFNQSDLLLMLCGSPAVWYVILRRSRKGGQPTEAYRWHIHQLRQVFSALLLGVGLLERRLARGAYNELSPLVQRMHNILREGAAVLAALDQPPLPAPAVEALASGNGHLTSGR